jgi:serine protease Do
MRWTACFMIVAATLLFGWLGPARAGDVSGNQAELIRGLLPSVVNITVHKKAAEPTTANASSGAGQDADSKVYVGSGFVFDPAGLIVTNEHVVDQAYDIVVTFSDGSVLPGEVLHASQLADIAVVKVQADHALQPVQWGDSTKLQIGDQVFAIGNALGLGMSVTAGIVSALNRDVMDSPYDHYIQTDAAINHGNSGGPLFDMNGRVVGVDTAIVSPTEAFSGLGLAIPSDSAHFVVDNLVKYGWVHPGWIGVKLQQVTREMAEAMGMAHAEGSVVSWVQPGAPASEGGIEIGDVVLRFADDAPRDERGLLRDIARTPEGTQVRVVVLRDGTERTIPVTVAAWPRSLWDEFDTPLSAEQPPKPVSPDLGLTFEPVPVASRAKLGLTDDASGVLVAAVTPGSDAARRGLVTGDVILRVQAKTVSTPDGALAALEAERAEKRRFVMLLVLQKARKVPGPSWVAVRLPASGAL